MPRLNLKSPHFFQVLSLIAIAMIGFGFRIIILLRVLVFYSGQNLLIFSFLFSLIAFSGFLFHPVVGFLADRSRRQTFLIAIVCYGTSPLMLIFSNNIPLVFFLGIIEGIGDAAHSSSLQMSYFDLSSSSRKASTRSAWYLSLVSTLSSTGAAFFLALFSSSSQDLQFYLSLFFVFYLVYVLFGITIPETVQNGPKLSLKLLGSIKSSLKGVIASITGIKDMSDAQRPLVLQYVLFMFVFGMADSFVSCVSVAIFYDRLSFSNMALTYGILGLATLLGSFIVYCRENKNLVLTTLQLTFSLFLLEMLRITFLFTPNPLIFIPALIFANICSGLITLNITSTWHHILHPEIRARSSGLLSITSCVVTFAPFVGAWVYQSLGLPILILGFLLMKITGIFIFTGFYDSYKRGMHDPLQKTNQLVTACA